MNSGLYFGSVRHRRFGERANRFRYGLFMAYIDLNELPRLFDRYWLWSARRPAPAWFRRKDYYGDPAIALDAAVRNLVQQYTGQRPTGPIRLLTHLRYFGYSFNPVSFYYIFDPDGQTPRFILAEITNTPWKERHVYLLDVEQQTDSRLLRWQFNKAFHVSPFLPMALHYDWRFSAPGETVHVHMTAHEAGELRFDATLSLRRRPITHRVLAAALVRFPLMTLQVTALIYWQALRLYWRRTPFFNHPKSLAR